MPVVVVVAMIDKSRGVVGGGSGGRVVLVVPLWFGHNEGGSQWNFGHNCDRVGVVEWVRRRGKMGLKIARLEVHKVIGVVWIRLSNCGFWVAVRSVIIMTWMMVLLLLSLFMGFGVIIILIVIAQRAVCI